MTEMKKLMKNERNKKNTATECGNRNRVKEEMKKKHVEGREEQTMEIEKIAKRGGLYCERCTRTKGKGRGVAARSVEK